MLITKHHEELAAEVRQNGVLKERQEFQLGNSHKVSEVYDYLGSRFYVTMTEGQLTFIHEGGTML